MKLLNGIKVLDMSRLIPGPYVTMLLADMGADVIKVEEQSVGDYLRIGREPEKWGGSIPLFLWLNRNKRDIAVNFKSKEGIEVIYELAKTCDVAVEGSRPGASAKLGLGYEHLRAVNPGIVYCSITGFGQDGPFAQLATHGGAYDAVAGLAVPHQVKDGSYVQNRPYPHGLTYGSWLSAMAVCAALLQKERTGEGAYLDVSCADATVMALGQEILGTLNGEGEAWPDPDEGDLSTKYCYYKTKDGRFMLIQAIEQHFWIHFCEVVGRPDLSTRGDWSVSRMDSSVGDTALRQELINLFATKTQEEWTKIFIENNIAGAPYYPLSEVENTELFTSREMIVQQDQPGVGKLKTVSNAIKVQGDPFVVNRPTPGKGEHTDEVLAEFGYSQQQIVELRERGTIS
jgi:crotonobetainyl-CoA:carnitine CoA-transferase CaiB-like acyl-CoA transferase